MTNTPSGSKRTWDESYGAEQPRRKRIRDKDDPRDWRDVHLNEGERKSSSNRKDRDGRYRHERNHRHEGNHRSSHKIERKPSVSLDYGRDDRDSHSTYSPGRHAIQTREPQKPSGPDSEKEEGE